MMSTFAIKNWHRCMMIRREVQRRKSLIGIGEKLLLRMIIMVLDSNKMRMFLHNGK